MRKQLIHLAILLSCVSCVTPTAEKVLTPREQAQRLLMKGDAVGALALLERLHQEAPKDLSVARALSEAHVKAGSADAFLKSLEGKKGAVDCYMRALVLFSRAADASGPAVEAFREAVAADPQEPEYRYRLGVALVESEKYDAGLIELKAALAAAPERFAWHLPLAKALAHTGSNAAAVESIRTVVTHPATPAEVKTARALMDQIADPFSSFPPSAKPALEQAMQWLYTADVPQQAIVELDGIVRDFPDIAIVHALLGLAAARIDDAGRAVEELKRAIDLDPTDGKAHLYLADFYAGRQRGTAAREHYEKAAQLNPTLSEAWTHLGDYAIEAQDLARARTCFEVAARLDPENPNTHGKVAAVYQREGDWPAAERELKAVVEREPENVEFMLRLGLLNTERFLKVGASDEKKTAQAEAEKWLTKVLAEQPENALASRALERLKMP